MGEQLGTCTLLQPEMPEPKKTNRMNKAAIVFPHQLFPEAEALKGVSRVFLVEDSLYFTQFPFHKHKLILHRAAMQVYADALRDQGKTVTYVEFDQQPDLAGITHLQATDPDDDWLSRKLKKAAQKAGCELQLFPNPNFLTPLSELTSMLGDKTLPELPETASTGHPTFFMHHFYQKQRKRTDLLMDNGSPLGGKWSFDADNRKKLPKGLVPPVPAFPAPNVYVQEAQTYVKTHFPDNPGKVENFHWAVTRKAALDLWQNFLDYRMDTFGPYEDALSSTEAFVYHSLLTPALNIGLLNPQEIIDSLMEAHAKKDYPLASLEGFIRQVIGWREFMRGIYRNAGGRQRTSNFFGFTRKIPASFWDGTTGIVPVDLSIQRALINGYAHHIERLMVLGNFMLLCEFDPHEVYEWFTALFIDAYDWVMVPNVYGMSQFADGGLITTKPYLSGSNYIRKMSDFKKGDWCEVWDGLYWRFIGVHGHKFEKNVRMRMVLNLWGKMDEAKRDKHLKVAEEFLQKFP